MESAVLHTTNGNPNIVGHGYPRVETFARTGNRKQAIEANVRGIEFRSQDIEGYSRKKALKPDVRRKIVNYVFEAHKTSERRACRLAALSRSGFRYVRKKPNNDEVKAKLAQIAEDHHRWGFRKMAAILRKQGN